MELFLIFDLLDGWKNPIPNNGSMLTSVRSSERIYEARDYLRVSFSQLTPKCGSLFGEGA